MAKKVNETFIFRMFFSVTTMGQLFIYVSETFVTGTCATVVKLKGAPET